MLHLEALSGHRPLRDRHNQGTNTMHVTWIPPLSLCLSALSLVSAGRHGESHTFPPSESPIPGEWGRSLGNHLVK
jgi:hypothetical protein